MSATEHTEKKTVFYHHPCLDGSTAIWALNEAWKDKGDEVKWVGLDFSDLEKVNRTILQNVDADTNVYFVDYVPKTIHKNAEKGIPADVSILEKLAKGPNKVKSITIYDHHLTAQQEVEKFQEKYKKNKSIKITFDMNRSGAGIAWDEEHHHAARPQIVKLAQKSDLLNLYTEKDGIIAAFLDAQKIEGPVATMAMLSKMNAMPLNTMAAKGKHLFEKLQETTHRVLNEDRMMWAVVDALPGCDPVAVPYISVHPSEIGRWGMKEVVKAAGHSAPAYVAFIARPEGNIMNISVRCGKGLHIAAEVAKYMGEKYGISGGGHGDQGSFQMTIEQHYAVFGKRGNRHEIFKQWREAQNGTIDKATNVIDIGEHRHSAAR